MPFLTKTIGGGCVLTGKLLHGNQVPMTGSLQFLPEHGGVYKGVYYSAERIFVAPAQDGAFSVILAPSSVMGTWTLVLPTGDALSLTIPDKDNARLEEVVN